MCFRPIPEPSRSDLLEPPRHASHYTAHAPRTGARVAALPAESFRRSHDDRRSFDDRRSYDYGIVERRGGGHRRSQGATPRSSQRRIEYVDRAPGGGARESVERVRVVTRGP